LVNCTLMLLLITVVSLAATPPGHSQTNLLSTTNTNPIQLIPAFPANSSRIPPSESTPFLPDDPTYRSIDSLSFAQFTSGDLRGLRRTIRQANRAKIDFFYLRLRAGIVAYNQRDYTWATRQLEKALFMNPADDVTAEYLYWSYRFMGRHSDAVEMAEKRGYLFRQRVGYRFRPRNTMWATMGRMFTNNVDDNLDRDFLGSGDLRADVLLHDDMRVISAAITTRLLNRFTVTNMAQVFTTESVSRIIFPGGYAESNNWDTHIQYNLAGTFEDAAGWTASLNAGVYYVNPSYLVTPDPEVARFVSAGDEQVIVAGTLSAGWRFWRVYPVASVSLSGFQQRLQVQPTLGMTLYPTGSMRRYLNGSVSQVNDDGTDRLVWSAGAGITLHPKVHLDIATVQGNQLHYQGNGGFLTYNTANPITEQYRATVRIDAGSVIIIPSLTQQIRRQQWLITRSDVSFDTPAYTYSNHLLTLTMQWNF
jgi:hypothetical protein